jgi:Ca2+-binding EF-hand superfamily protein
MLHRGMSSFIRVSLVKNKGDREDVRATRARRIGSILRADVLRVKRIGWARLQNALRRSRTVELAGAEQKAKRLRHTLAEAGNDIARRTLRFWVVSTRCRTLRAAWSHFCNAIGGVKLASVSQRGSKITEVHVQLQELRTNRSELEAMLNESQELLEKRTLRFWVKSVHNRTLCAAWSRLRTGLIEASRTKSSTEQAEQTEDEVRLQSQIKALRTSRRDLQEKLLQANKEAGLRGIRFWILRLIDRAYRSAWERMRKQRCADDQSTATDSPARDEGGERLNSKLKVLRASRKDFQPQLSEVTSQSARRALRSWILNIVRRTMIAAWQRLVTREQRSVERSKAPAVASRAPEAVAPNRESLGWDWNGPQGLGLTGMGGSASPWASRTSSSAAEAVNEKTTLVREEVKQEPSDGQNNDQDASTPLIKEEACTESPTPPQGLDHMFAKAREKKTRTFCEQWLEKTTRRSMRAVWQHFRAVVNSMKRSDSEYRLAQLRAERKKRQEAVLSQGEVMAHWADTLRHDGRVYCKTTNIHAKVALESGVLETVVGGIVEARKTYEVNDYIVCGSRGGRYPMRAADFISRYERGRPQPATDPALGEEGFRLFTPTGKIWARQISDTEVEAHFPAGKFLGKGSVDVFADDFLAMPFPTGGEIYVIKQSLFVNTYALNKRVKEAPTIIPRSNSSRESSRLKSKDHRIKSAIIWWLDNVRNHIVRRAFAKFCEFAGMIPTVSLPNGSPARTRSVTIADNDSREKESMMLSRGRSATHSNAPPDQKSPSGNWLRRNVAAAFTRAKPATMSKSGRQAPPASPGEGSRPLSQDSPGTCKPLFDATRTVRLCELFNRFDHESKGSLLSFQLRALLQETGFTSAKISQSAILDEFGEDRPEGRAVTFDRFLELVHRLEDPKNGEEARRRLSISLLPAERNEATRAKPRITVIPSEAKMNRSMTATPNFEQHRTKALAQIHANCNPDSKGAIDTSDLSSALDDAGFKVSVSTAADLLSEYGKRCSGGYSLNFESFQKLVAKLDREDVVNHDLPSYKPPCSRENKDNIGAKVALVDESSESKSERSSTSEVGSANGRESGAETNSESGGESGSESESENGSESGDELGSEDGNKGGGERGDRMDGNKSVVDNGVNGGDSGSGDEGTSSEEELEDNRRSLLATSTQRTAEEAGGTKRDAPGLFASLVGKSSMATASSGKDTLSALPASSARSQAGAALKPQQTRQATVLKQQALRRSTIQKVSAAVTGAAPLDHIPGGRMLRIELMCLSGHEVKELSPYVTFALSSDDPDNGHGASSSVSTSPDESHTWNPPEVFNIPVRYLNALREACMTSY